MLKWFCLALSLSTLPAYANDSGIVLVDLLGVAPARGVQNAQISIYGEDTHRLAAALPITDVDGGRSVHLASAQWLTYISCAQDYQRPTTGEERDDWMCTIGIEPRAGSVLQYEDLNVAPARADDFNSFNGTGRHQALGIRPPRVLGELFNIYGGGLGLLAEKLPDTLTFSSSRFRVQMACDREYVRPTTGERRRDYQCSVATIER